MRRVFGVMPAVSAFTPAAAPLALSGGGGLDRVDHWGSSDNSVEAVSFGFVATAILISMFLVMAIFERFLRPSSPLPASNGGRNPNGSGGSTTKLEHSSPKVSFYPSGVSVLMPGETVPTYLAHPAPPPCPII